jgi:archaellum component FlaC
MLPVKEAVEKLDPSNDAHWTQDGLPLVDAVRILAGNPGVTRDDINKALPGFVRPQAATPSAGAPPPPPVQGATSDTPISAPAAAQAEQPPEDPGALVQAPMVADVGDLEAMQNSLADMRVDFDDATKALAEAKQRVHDLQNNMSVLEDKILKATKASGENPVMSYLERQKQELAERARKQNMIRESGIDLKALGEGMKAPIDAAFQRRTARGGNRPTGAR